MEIEDWQKGDGAPQHGDPALFISTKMKQGRIHVNIERYLTGLIMQINQNSRTDAPAYEQTDHHSDSWIRVHATKNAHGLR